MPSSNSPEEMDERFRGVCHKNKWKCTAQRRSVFTYLYGNKTHPTVEMVWTNARRRLPDMSLDSVYRILGEFAAVGLVRRLEGARVIRYDPDTTPHAHFLCVECGRMFDIAHAKTEGIDDDCRRFGRVLAVELSVRGLCHACAGGEN